MATGTEGSAQQKFGERYRALLAAHGVELRLVVTEGSVDNLRRLNDPLSGVSVAFVQAGLTSPADAPDLVSLGTVFYEPVWVLYKGDLSGRASEWLKGKRLSIGPEGSGTRKLGLELMAASGVNLTGVDLHYLPDQDVAAAFRDGKLDAAVIVAPWESTVVQQLLTSEQINAATFPRADAQVALRPFLYKVILPEGVADLARNKPPAILCWWRQKRAWWYARTFTPHCSICCSTPLFVSTRRRAYFRRQASFRLRSRSTCRLATMPGSTTLPARLFCNAICRSGWRF